MTKCEKEGQFTATVTGVQPIEHRFNQAAIEIRLDFADEDGNTGRIYLDLSDDYATGGNRKGDRQCDISADALSFYGVDIRAATGIGGLSALEGKQVSVYGKINSKGYHNFSLNTSKPESRIAVQDAAARMKALFGGAPAPAKEKPKSAVEILKASKPAADADDAGDDDLDGPNPF